MSSQAFGYNFSLGFAPEATYGTAVAPSGFIEISDENLTYSQAPEMVSTLRTASMRDYVEGTVDVKGDITFPLFYQGAESLFKAVTCGTPNSVVTSGTYATTYKLSDAMPAGMTLYVNRDASNIGASGAFFYTGCQFSTFTLTCDIKKPVEVKAAVVGRDEIYTSGVPVTYPSNTIPLVTFSDITATINGTPVTCESFEVEISNPIADSRYALGDRRRFGQGRKDKRKVSGKIKLPFDTINYYNLYKNFSEFSIVATATSSTIAANGIPFSMKITIPRAVFTGTTPGIKNIGPVDIEMPFDAFYDKVNSADEITITTVNTASTIL